MPRGIPKNPRNEKRRYVRSGKYAAKATAGAEAATTSAVAPAPRPPGNHKDVVVTMSLDTRDFLLNCVTAGLNAELKSTEETPRRVAKIRDFAEATLCLLDGHPS